MAGQAQPKHPTPETLVDYFDRRLSRWRETEIKRHLARCPKCKALARRVEQLSNEWSRWTAASHAAALRAAATKASSRAHSSATVRRRGGQKAGSSLSKQKPNRPRRFGM